MGFFGSGVGRAPLLALIPVIWSFFLASPLASGRSILTGFFISYEMFTLIRQKRGSEESDGRQRLCNAAAVSGMGRDLLLGRDQDWGFV